MNLDETLAGIEPADRSFAREALKKWDSIAKPLGSLGLLESAIEDICAMERTLDPSLDDKRVVVFCADNGVVAEAITQTGQDVTAIVAHNLCTGDASVCKMAAVAGAQVVPVDMGMARRVDHPNMRVVHIGDGTADMLHGPAMTREQAVRAVEAGIAIAEELVEDGCDLFAAGEMGIGNTTTSSAVASVLTGLPAKEMSGPGAGLSQEAVAHKVEVIEQAIEFNQPDPDDSIDVLAKVGGFDLCGMVGLYLGCARLHKPCLVDGFISSVAALVACRLCPAVSGYLIATHVSSEPASRRILVELGLSPAITAGMHLGEGSGAVAAMPLLDMALAVYEDMPTFDETGIAPYERFDDEPHPVRTG